MEGITETVVAAQAAKEGSDDDKEFFKEDELQAYRDNLLGKLMPAVTNELESLIASLNVVAS